MTTDCAESVFRLGRPRRRPLFLSEDRPGGLAAAIIGMAALWLIAGIAAAQSSPCHEDSEAKRQLFDDLTVATRAIRPVSDTTLYRSRTVTVRMDSLPKAGADHEATVPFNLFPDATFEGLVEKMEARGPTNYTVSGSLEDHPEGSFVLSRNGDVVVAEVNAGPLGLYEVRSVGGGAHEVRQVNDTALLGCGNGPLQNLQRRPRTREFNPPEAEVRTGTNFLDVMVVYTTEARIAAGGTAAMENTVQNFVAAANTTYANSQINTQLRLVYAGEVNYVESGSASVDLSRLTYVNDGHLEEVHALRNLYGADVVSLLVNDFDYCGIGWMHNGPTRAFSVVDFGCGSSTFVHEIGHNMGCAHDRANAGSQGEFPYSYGHRFTGQSGSQWRTVMSYAPGQRIQHFSNPAVTYDGVATGVPESAPNSANNARTVNQTSPTMAGYRPAQDMIDCNGNFTPDDVDLQSGTSEDCNGNNVPDECDLANGSSHDENDNEVPDECDCDASACEDGVACTLDTCNPNTGACVFVWGAIPFGDLNYNGQVDVDDVSCALAGFQNLYACPDADVVPCGSGDNLLDVDDLQAILAAFDGTYACASSCP